MNIARLAVAAMVVVTSGASCSFTNSLADRTRDYGNPLAVDDASADQGAPPGDGSPIANDGGIAGFCATHATSAIKCDDFDRASPLATDWSDPIEDGTGEIDFDGSRSLSAPRSLKVMTTPTNQHAAAALHRSINFPTGRVRVELDVFIPEPGAETFLLAMSFGPDTSLSIVMGGSYGLRVIQRGAGGYLETGATGGPNTQTWNHFVFHFDANAAAFSLDLNDGAAIKSTTLKTPAAEYGVTADLAVGIVDQYPDPVRRAEYNIDNVLVSVD